MALITLVFVGADISVTASSSDIAALEDYLVGKAYQDYLDGIDEVPFEWFKIPGSDYGEPIPF